MNKLNMIKGLTDVRENVPIICLDTQNNVYEIVSLKRVTAGSQDETMAILACIKKEGKGNGVCESNTGEPLCSNCDPGNPSGAGILDYLLGVR